METIVSRINKNQIKVAIVENNKDFKIGITGESSNKEAERLESLVAEFSKLGIKKDINLSKSNGSYTLTFNLTPNETLENLLKSLKGRMETCDNLIKAFEKTK